MSAAPDRRLAPHQAAEAFQDDGFMLIAVIIMVFLVLLVLSVAAPRMARQLQREQDVEAKHRAEQYVVAIRKFYGTFGRYPSSVKELEGTNNQRFLRAEYVDPLTGKSDWRLIHLGENKTKVKGLFGQELPGLPGGLGAASGMQSSPGTTPSAFGSPSATNGLGGSTLGSPGLAANSGPGLSTAPAPGSSDTAAPGTPTPAAPGNSATGTPGTSTTAAGNGTSGTPGTPGGLGSSGFPTSGGLIMGIGVPKSGDSVASQNGESTYQKWEFLYDPRIEQLHAGWSVFGGGGPGSTPASGLGGGSQQNGFPGNNTPGGSGTPGGFGSSTFGSGFGSSGQQPGSTSPAPGTPANPSAPANPSQPSPANPQGPPGSSTPPQ